MAALIIVTTVYCLVQVVVIHMLPNSALTGRPLSAAAQVFGGSRMATIISVGALLSTFGHFAANMIAAPRITFAFAEQGDFPRWFAAIHRRYQHLYISIVAFAVLFWALALMGTFRWNARSRVQPPAFSFTERLVPLCHAAQEVPRNEGFHLPGGLAFAALGIAFALVLLSRMGFAELVALATYSSHFVPELACCSWEYALP